MAQTAGGHVLGNFHAYYSFNPVNERLRFMDAETSAALRAALLAPDDANASAVASRSAATVMDIGCNEGDLTIGLASELLGIRDRSSRVEQIEFDNSSVSELNKIVQKQKHQIEYVFSEDGTTDHRRHYLCDLRINGDLVAKGDGISKKIAKAKAAGIALKVFTEQEQDSNAAGDAQTQSEARIQSTTMTANEAPLPPSRKRLCVLGVDVDEELIARASKKPCVLEAGDAVEFVHASVMGKEFRVSVDSFLKRVGRPRSSPTANRSFDLITVFSVTMWIHLNHGDDGLWTFLETVTNMTDHLIVEPQPWKCYRNAVKRLIRLGSSVPLAFRSLQIRDNVVEKIDSFLLDAGRFRFKAELGKTNWSRRIVLYSRAPVPGITYSS